MWEKTWVHCDDEVVFLWVPYLNLLKTKTNQNKKKKQKKNYRSVWDFNTAFNLILGINELNAENLVLQ